MSLLLVERDPEFQRLTSEIFERQLAANPPLREQLDGRARQKMYQDVQYNVDLLHTALYLEDGGIFTRYARWLYQLLTALMPNCTREWLRDAMVEHYQLIRTCMQAGISPARRPKLHAILDAAVQATADECAHSTLQPPTPGKYEAEINRYISCLLQSDTGGAMSLIAEYMKDGIELGAVCVEIVAEALRRVGELWHSNRISVDMEHYCTSVTQMALAQLYPLIFGQARRGKTVLVACVGSELHEIGPRMVADLFEYHGWDSVYLGAAVPPEAIRQAVGEHRPDLVALSVTMPQHLPVCRQAVELLRAACPELKIAVGGNAFRDSETWKNWGVDIYTDDARDLVQWADELL